MESDCWYPREDVERGELLEEGGALGCGQWGEGAAGRAGFDALHVQDGFGGGNLAVFSEDFDQADGLVLALAGGWEVAGVEGADEAVVERCGVVVGAADGPFDAKGEGGEEHFIAAEEDVERIAGEGEALLQFHQVAVGILDAGKRRDALLRLAEEIGHGEMDAGHGREMVEVERKLGRGGGYGDAEIDQICDGLWLEEKGGEGGDGMCAGGLRLGGEGLAFDNTEVAYVDDDGEAGRRKAAPFMSEKIALGFGEREPFAGGAANKRGGNVAFEEEIDLIGDGGDVKSSIGCHGCVRCGDET